MGLQIRDEKKKGVADVVFCFDCTGSMSGVIENVKNHANKFVEGLNADGQTKMDWRARAVGYGDLTCGEEIQNGNKFVDNVAAFQDQVRSLRNVGGGDEPESTLDAIVVAAKTSEWRSPCHRIVVVFTDATTKDLDSSTCKSFSIKDFDDMVKDLSRDHIKIFLWGAHDVKYEKMKMIAKSQIVQMDSPHTELESGANMADLLKQMGATVSSYAPSEML